MSNNNSTKGMDEAQGKPYVIRFGIDGRPQKWIRYAKDMGAALKDAKAAIAKEWPGKKVGKLRITRREHEAVK